jgi:hypothetical protein
MERRGIGGDWGEGLPSRRGYFSPGQFGPFCKILSPKLYSHFWVKNFRSFNLWERVEGSLVNSNFN